ncbi:methyl-CpG-binding domain protein 5-like [Haliotis cracherodii]|uniref:methyl-CpG-binding domain protein 5-like n=1 Tax=Haliotis cracherodii TaxID=6455 RepID=UPI0039EB3A12
MNFDNGQGLKFGVSNYGQGLANATNVCHFQYMGMGEAQGAMKPGQGIPQMPVDRNTFVPPYHNVGLAHHQGNPAAQAGFPMGVNISMSSPMSFNSLPPMESFGGHNQGFPPNQRPGMNYKNFNNWVGPNQSNQTSLPSIGHLWSHFQQQQIQKHTVQQPPPHQQNFYPNQQHMQGFQNTLALSPNMAGGPRGQNISYQYQAQNPTVVNHSRMYQNFPQERMQNCIYGSQNVPTVSQSVAGVNDQHIAKAPGQSHPVHHVETAGPQVTAICNQVTKTTTTITMTTCNSSPLTTAMAHVNVTVPSVLTSVAVTKPAEGPGESPRNTPGVEAGPPVSVSGCASHHTKPKVSDGADSEGTECEQDSMESKDIEPSLQIVKVPFGWRRTTENGTVVYYSPSNTRLCSYHEVCKYLSAEGTCKCGLECPLLVEKVFNFDPLVNGKLWTVDDMATGDLTKLCIHKRKIIAMATFQSSRSMSVSKDTDKISHSGTGGHSRKGKKSKSKVNSTPYDGLLVSQLLAQKGKVKPPMNHTHKHTKPKGDGSQNPIDGPGSKSSNNVTPVSNAVPKMFENKSVPCKSQALQQLQQLNKLNNSVGNVLPDPADDLGPITCQVPAKLDFSKEGFLEDQKNRLQTSMAGHTVGQAIFHQGSVSPQAPFSQEQLKHQLLMQQSASPCAPTASPSLVNSVPNHMYGPNVPQHFQCQLPMNMQQNSGNIMFQTLMHVQNPQAQRFTNPPVFEQANMQGNHLQVGSQPNLMINQGYPHLGNLTWLDPGKPKAKRPRSKKDKQKLNSILDRTSPCPNVDVRHIPQEASKNPSSINTSVSFMENPAAFLAQQTALVHSSLSSTKTDMSQPSPRTPQPSVSTPPSVSTSVQNKTVPVTTASSPASEPTEEVPDKVLPQGTCSISEPSAASSTSTGTVTTAKTPGLLKVDDGANCDRSDTPAIEKLDVSEKEASTSEQCCDDKTRSSPASNATLPSDAKANSLESSEPKDSDCVSEANTTNSTKPNISQQSQTPTSSNAAIVTLASTASATEPATTATNLVMPSDISELIAANNLNLNAVQQALSQQGPGEFPASTLLSAAARAQGSQQNPLNVLLGQPMQVSPSLQVPTGQETATPTAIPDMMSKAGINTLDQLNLSLQQQGGGTLMLPQNPNILAGALPGGYINTLNGPTVQGLPLNMFLPVNQPIGNSTGLNPAQNLLIGLDPKSGANSQTSKQATTTGRVSGVESTKGLDGFNGPAVNFPTLFANVAGGPSTIGANMKLSTTSSSNASQVSAGVNASLLNNQFPYVTMNTPMPPMSLPLVTNVTNSLSQVIPAVGVPQTVLNQQPVTSLISTVTVPTLNNSVVITNQIPSMHTSQTGTQNIAFMGVQQPQGGEPENNANVGTAEDVNSVGSSMASTETVCVSESGQANVPKLETTHQGVETLMNKLVNQPTEVMEQMNNNTGQVVLLPNPNIPLLQLYGANPLLAAPGIDKFGLNSMQQVMLHGTMIDPQLCQGQPAVGGGLNLLQMQQMWNNAGNGNMTNLNAIQLQQLQALQLQLLLQQIQGMQSLVNQIQLHGAAQQTLNPDGTIPTQVPTVGEVEEEVKVEVKEEEEEEEEDGDTQDADLSPSGECEFKSECDQNLSKNYSPDQPVNENDVGYGIKDSFENEVSQEPKAVCDATGAGANDITCSKSEDGDSLVETSQTKKDHEFGVSENSRSDSDKHSWHNTDSDDVSSSTMSVSDSAGEQKSCDTNLLDSSKTGTALRTKPQKESLGEAESPSVSNAVLGRGSSSSSVLDGSAASASDLPHVNHNGPEEDLCDDTDSLDDDMSLDDLRRGLKRARTDDETDVDSTSIDNYDEESIDGMVSEGYLQNFSTGDVVWGQIRGFPLWPGKLVPESAAEGIELNPSLEDRADAVLVMWYGDHTFTRVEPQRLKTWGEGMVAHHKTRRKYRRGRKMNSHLEAAIQEAVKDIKDMPVVNSETAAVKPSVKGRATKKRKA